MPWRSSSPLPSERLLHSAPLSLCGSMSVKSLPCSSWFPSFDQVQFVNTLTTQPLLAELDKPWTQPPVSVRICQPFQPQWLPLLKLSWQLLPQLQVLQAVQHPEVQRQQCLRWTKAVLLLLNRSHPRKITVWADLLFLRIKQCYIFWTTISSFWERCSSFSI